MRIPRLLLRSALALLALGCAEATPEGAEAPGFATPGANQPAPPPAQSDMLRPAESEGSSANNVSAGSVGIRIVFLGTSLTEGLGLDRPSLEAWPTRVGELGARAGLDLEITNAGVGGETSAGALRRLDWVLQQSPDLLVVETGANDGLRGLPVNEMEANLRSIVGRVQALHPDVTVLLVQMEAPPNMGPDYVSAFREAYSSTAQQMGVSLIPFLLEGVAGRDDLNQADGIHPTAEGHRIMAENAWPVLEELLTMVAAR